MAIKLNDYKKIDINIYRHKQEKNKFLFIFQFNNKQRRKIYIIDERPNWNKRQYLAEVRILKEESYKEFQEEMKGKKLKKSMILDELFLMFFATQDKTLWNKKRVSFYNFYVKKILGKKMLEDISPYDIEVLISSLVKMGKSERTSKKVLEILNPMFQMAKKNKCLIDNPCDNVNFSYKKKKKFVINPTEKFISLFNAINKLYQDDPYYKAIFMLALTGRRKSEILDLTWESIDLKNNVIWLNKTKNGNPYKIPLYKNIKEALLELPEFMSTRCAYNYVQEGIVFKGFINGKRINHLENQYDKIKKEANIPEWHLHYCRHILVSMLNDQGANQTTLSDALLHESSMTLGTYLSNNVYKSGIEIENIITNITSNSEAILIEN